MQSALLVVVALSACTTSAGPPSAPLEASAGPREGCHPLADAARPQFIVGYGSLMQDQSRERTAPHAGPAHPVEIAGYERGWFERGSGIGFSTTYLGARPRAGARMNAVIYAIGAEELAATDARESSYCRAPVARASMEELDPRSRLPEDAELWIYVTDPRRIAAPDASHPIVESYVDVFLSGCLEQEERFHVKGFARECIATTTGWSGDWVNDRIYPRRPFIFQPRAGEIDRLLAASVPREFAAIRLEPR